MTEDMFTLREYKTIQDPENANSFKLMKDAKKAKIVHISIKTIQKSNAESL